MGPGRRTTRSSNAQPQPHPQPQPQSMPSSQSANASLGVMESGGRTASSSTLPQSRPNVSVGSSSGSGAASTPLLPTKKRGKAMNTTLINHKARIRPKPRIKIPPGRSKPVGSWSEQFAYEIGIICRKYAPLAVQNWRTVKKEFKSKVNTMHEHIMKLSTKNKANRGQKKVNHRGGSRSFLNHRADKVNAETQQEPGRIEFYRMMRRAEAAERQAEEYERQVQELTTRLHENKGRVEELQNWKTASEAKLEFLMAHIGARFSVPPPIALAISYGSSISHPRGCPAGGRVGSRSPLLNSVHGGLFAFAGSREILRVFRPDSIASGHRFIGTTKSLMLTLSISMLGNAVILAQKHRTRSKLLAHPTGKAFMSRSFNRPRAWSRSAMHGPPSFLSLGPKQEKSRSALLRRGRTTPERLPLGVACGSDCDGQYMSVITEHRPSSKVSSGLDALCSNQVPSQGRTRSRSSRFGSIARLKPPFSLTGWVLMSPILFATGFTGCLSWVRALTRTNTDLEADTNMPPLEDVDAEGSKMEEVD
ncbi:hypothetical protein IFM89_006815 [Coptis chinensis]|uniref:Uncharacterized protein n=1 Tax=Coptis chinensis TaxID=261450 RepID=A0A835I852_9MAGN|nr:hypothetical protein IFM89_006815 [Coptis chinensis]